MTNTVETKITLVQTQAKREELTQATSVLNSAVKSKESSLAVDVKVEDIETSIKEYTDMIKSLRMDELLALPSETMITTFIDNPQIKTVTLRKNTDGSFELKEKDMTLSFVDLQEYSKKPVCKDIYIHFVALFMDNIARVIATDHGTKELPVSKLNLNAHYAKLREQYNFETTSKNSLMKQLELIVSAILPEGMEIKMLKADLNYLIRTMSKSANGRTTMMREKTFVNELFVALRFRKNSLAYQLNSKMEAHRTEK